METSPPTPSGPGRGVRARARRRETSVVFRRTRGASRLEFACRAAFVVVVVGVCTASCDRSSDAAARRLTLYAASSVADVARDIADRFEAKAHVTVTISQGSSGKLCGQIQHGAPCDVFIPADIAYLDRLDRANLLTEGSRTSLGRNEIVVVVADADWPPWSDAGRFLDESFGRIVLANPEHAPAGRYAVAALKHLGLWQQIETRVVYADNVRLAARYIASYGAGVGIVYATDAAALADRLSVVHRFGDGEHDPIIYQGAVCDASSQPGLATEFLAFASSSDAADRWRAHGFTAESTPAALHRAEASMFSSNDLYAIRLSLLVSFAATLLFLPLGVALGVWLARNRSTGRTVVQTVVMIPLVLPPVVTGLFLLKGLQAAGSPIAFTWLAAVVASGAVAMPLLVRTVRASVEAMDARLLAVAATLGSSRMRIFFTVTLPVCWKGIVGGAVLFWARSMGEFGAVMVAATNTPGRTQTIPLAIYSKLESASDASIWPLVVASLTVSVGAIALSEWLVRDKRRAGRGNPDRGGGLR